MSDCSREAWQAPRGIDGAIHWNNGNTSELHYARFVNGEERKAEYVELDGVKFVPELACEPEEVYIEPHESNLTVTVCSNCRVTVCDLEDCNYCPNCGAKVRKVDE